MAVIKPPVAGDTSVGCDDCKFLKGKRCTMWEVKVSDPHNSHCEIITCGYGKK